MQAQQPQLPPQALQQNTDPTIRVLGAVKNPILVWSDGLTLAHALVECEYEKPTAPRTITIYCNNQPFDIFVQLTFVADLFVDYGPGCGGMGYLLAAMLAVPIGLLLLLYGLIRASR